MNGIKLGYSQYTPVVTEGNEAHVHHLLIYLCDGLNNTHVGASGDCDDGVDESVQECRGGTLIAAWAVGGDVSDKRHQYSVERFCMCIGLF